MPLPLLKASVATALSWEWSRFALMLLIGFFGLLRPCELFGLKASDCILSSDSGCANVIFLRLQLVKARTRGARRQSVRLEEPFVVDFLQRSLNVMTSSERLWSYSPGLFRSRLKMVLKEVADQPNLCVPSSLRPGGATYLFRLWQEDLVRLEWRGRWLHMKTLAHYVQELGCCNVMQSLSPAALKKVHQLAALCEPACAKVVLEVDLVSQVERLVQQVKVGRLRLQPRDLEVSR